MHTLIGTPPGMPCPAAAAHLPTSCVPVLLHTVLPPPLQETRRAYRQLFYTAPIGEAGISGAIMFKETLYQSADDGTPFVECLRRQGVLPGIKARGEGAGWCGS